jgi:hypothetical protein
MTRGLPMAIVVLLLAGACEGGVAGDSTVPGAGNPTAPMTTEQTSWDWTLAEPTETNALASVVPSTACGAVDRLFVAMFASLSAAALSNAGIDREDFLAALSSDREALKQYLVRLHIDVDATELDSLMSADLGQRLLGGSSEPGADRSADPSGDAVAVGPWASCE